MNDDCDNRLDGSPRRDRPKGSAPSSRIDLDAVPPLIDVSITVAEDSSASWDRSEGESR